MPRSKGEFAPWAGEGLGFLFQVVFAFDGDDTRPSFNLEDFEEGLRVGGGELSYRDWETLQTKIGRAHV